MQPQRDSSSDDAAVPPQQRQNLIMRHERRAHKFFPSVWQKGQGQGQGELKLRGMHWGGGGWGGGGCLGLGIVSMSRCPEMQVASCASCMCEVLPLLACQRDREREAKREREVEREQPRLATRTMKWWRCCYHCCHTVAGKHANYVASLAAAAAAAAAPIVPVEWRPCLLCVCVQHEAAWQEESFDKFEYMKQEELRFVLEPSALCVECANFLGGRKHIKSWGREKKKK